MNLTLLYIHHYHYLYNILQDYIFYYYYNKKKFLGKVFEIKAFEKLKNKYSEARFYRTRIDLDENICVFDETFDDN